MPMDTQDARKARVSLLYYSGAGGTRLVAELLGELLAPSLDSRVSSVSEARAAEQAADSELVVLCYPTYFLKPAPSMREFIEALGPFDPPRSAYLVTTYELYSENSLRVCALQLRSRGLLVVGTAAVRAPGTDATCVLPGRLCPWLYRFEKGLPSKLDAIAGEIRALSLAAARKAFIPAVKWYTPFSQLLQVLLLNGFEGWRGRIRALPERCTLCGACVRTCDRKAWQQSGGELRHLSEGCELCTRCIHRCPANAIVLIEGLKDNPRLNPRLFAALKAEAQGRLGLEAEYPDSVGIRTFAQARKGIHER